MLDIYWINTGSSLAAEMFVVLFYAKVTSIKYVRLKNQIYLILSLPCMHFQKEIALLKQ